jgi:acyl dehydratase
LSTQIGTEIGSSAWKTITQERIDCFAKATDDFQFVHVDRERAVRETPFGGTIAHGFLTLSMISAFAEEAIALPPNLKAVVLIAVDQAKFVSPVKSGSQIRGVFRLDRATFLSRDKVLMKLHCVIEVKDEPKPAMSCDLSWMLVLEDRSSAEIDAPPSNQPLTSAQDELRSSV